MLSPRQPTTRQDASWNVLSGAGTRSDARKAWADVSRRARACSGTGSFGPFRMSNTLSEMHARRCPSSLTAAPPIIWTTAYGATPSLASASALVRCPTRNGHSLLLSPPTGHAPLRTSSTFEACLATEAMKARRCLSDQHRHSQPSPRAIARPVSFIRPSGRADALKWSLARRVAS
jgi:hypothetical protein